MAWEIIHTSYRLPPNCDMWRGRDAEGRPIYAVTRRLDDGARVEPSTGFYSQKIAIEVYREKED